MVLGCQPGINKINLVAKSESSCLQNLSLQLLSEMKSGQERDSLKRSKKIQCYNNHKQMKVKVGQLDVCRR